LFADLLVIMMILFFPSSVFLQFFSISRRGTQAALVLNFTLSLPTEEDLVVLCLDSPRSPAEMLEGMKWLSQ